MFSRISTSKQAIASITRKHIKLDSYKRYNSSHSQHDHHHSPKEEKPFEITITKIFGIAAILGGLLMYRSKDKTDEPLFKSGLFEQETNGARSHLRDQAFENRYKIGFIKTFILDNEGLGNQMYRRTSGEEILNNNLIGAHSPFGQQYGAGIKLNDLSSRRPRIERFAPLESK
ncbi:uncharacterized protein KGF55_002455 [Candida pseudojiufengensis]|uniref:uncharacterized protein n=1 Tax=Candida pseudojiufengensis TaxID=497109 RepID=UPI00222407DE|nr:uncharacterized protein KGF55_002455 [Candida pseudojiufengensis]KAI5963575.1 hypothetical protein KGF55_002455 [Candida pseudojiufengensis]